MYSRFTNSNTATPPICARQTKQFSPFVLALTITLGLLQSMQGKASELQLRILETTDLHAHIVDFDYYTDQPAPGFGLARTASLIKAARAEVKNALLVDNGDLIQGSALGDYWAAKGIKAGQVHSVYKAMNGLDYAVGNIGNHEFNYGLAFLQAAIKGANFPYINSNIIDLKTGQPLFTPFLIKTLQLQDNDGKPQTLKVGFIGFVPPQIMQWDKQHLSGKINVRDIKATAEEWIPKMRAQGADVVIAIPHSGISTRPYVAMAENSVYYLSQVKGIDAIAFGHSHGVFPSADFADIPGADTRQGTLNAVPAVMPGYWGNHLGIIDLTLSNAAGRWQVIQGRSEARPIYDPIKKQALVSADPTLVARVQADHTATRHYVAAPIGKSRSAIYNYLVQIQDDASLQLINDAQRAYVRTAIQGDPDLASLPVLSAAAPFKAGGRKNDPLAYLELAAGKWSLRNAVDLYPYPNTLVVLKITGAQLRDWLECSAGMFNQIDPQTSEPQELLNWDGFASYNFDVIDGVSYEIDVTQPARFDGACELLNSNAQRVTNLRYQGKKVAASQEFLMATNNYRAYGGKFAGTGGAQVVMNSPDDNRSILVNYLKANTATKGALEIKVDNNWRLKSIATTKPLQIIFETSGNPKAAGVIQKTSRYPLEYLGLDDLGFARYKLVLNKLKH